MHENGTMAPPHPPHVLLVEDDRDHQFLARLAFEYASQATELVIVEDVGAATAYLRGDSPFDDRAKHPLPDAILLDLRLPGRDGLQLLEWMQKEGHLPGIPTVLYSTGIAPEVTARALSLGVSQVVEKQVDFRAIVRVVIEVYRQATREEESQSARLGADS